MILATGNHSASQLQLNVVAESGFMEGSSVEIIADALNSESGVDAQPPLERGHFFVKRQ